jgi:hypothetical protein
MTDAADVALAEFVALRAELLQLQQGEVTTYAGAFTAIAAVGGFALAKVDGRVDLLLVLPIVLSGLGLVQAHFASRCYQMGDYIRECLWQRLPAMEGDAMPPSWEHYIRGSRRRLHGVIARIVIFAIPSIASLAITDHDWHTKLAPLWWGDILIMGLTGILAILALRQSS